MPTNTSNQGIQLPVGADTADGPVAFTNQTAGVEGRLVMRFASIADRTARVPVPIEGQVSHLADVDRIEVYDGTNWISLYTRSRYAFVRKSVNESLNTNTVLQNDDVLFAPLPTAGIFGFALDIFYDGPDAGDIKFAFTAPAGATGIYAAHAISTAGAAAVGTGQFGGTTTFPNTLICGTTGTGTPLLAIIKGEITMGGTAGNLQLQWAQNTSDATNTTVRARSRMEVWRIS